MNNLIPEYIENFVYLDIETIPREEPDTEEIKKQVPKSYKSQDAIDRWVEEKYDKEVKARSIDSTKGRLCSIAFGVNEDAEQANKATVIPYNEDEVQMIVDFWGALKSKLGRSLSTAGWVGHNIEKFDLPWLLHRFVLAGLPFYEIPHEPFDKRIYDTSKKFAFTDRYAYYSLDSVCTFLGIETKGDLDGSKVYEYFKKGKLDDIYHYNRMDVYRVRMIHNKLRGA